jgi:hypothetical protein
MPLAAYDPWIVKDHPVTGKDQFPFGVIAHLNNFIRRWANGKSPDFGSGRCGFDSYSPSKNPVQKVIS